MIRCDGTAKDGSGRLAQINLPVATASAAGVIIEQAAAELGDLGGVVNLCGERVLLPASPSEFAWTYTSA